MQKKDEELRNLPMGFMNYMANERMIAQTPKPPYYAVIFTSIRTDVSEGYAVTAEEMVHLASQQPGFLGVEAARNEVGITISYWASLDDIRRWKQNAEHLRAQQAGREQWYAAYTTRICLVERDYHFPLSSSAAATSE